MDRLRLLTVLAGAAGACLALAGSEQTNIPPPISFTLRNGQPLVVLCASMTVHEVRVEDYVMRSDPPGSVRWSESGEVALPAGAEIPLGVTSHGMVSVGDAESLFESDLSVRLVVSDVDSGPWRSAQPIELQTPLGNEQFSEGVWVGGNGQLLDRACEDFTSR